MMDMGMTRLNGVISIVKVPESEYGFFFENSIRLFRQKESATYLSSRGDSDAISQHCDTC